ncbi:L,D-transpeptidase family protein [Hyphobacterium marinum]|uniref:L,D-transpeptidase family protein n=1 Tax=Hyphobacterium marinum TaxID=3116574 RepID=A0ABU7LUW7_9PROT|nr:L,D-transpeptidase family protein [Hyphobacterium sp. Y6023]MEE2565353.1 L,D-transpeptidase family protein [Hyphobacterium sp. Y6023]
MTDWTVTAKGLFDPDGLGVRAALGKGGIKPETDKAEGDGATPLGRYAIRRVLYRADRGDRPATALPVRAIQADDGWCDAPGDPGYNRPVRLPYPASCERMIREDGLYDIVVVLGHNDDPPVPGMGSAIFLHCAREDYAPTEGCIALQKSDLEAFLARAQPGDHLVIA